MDLTKELRADILKKWLAGERAVIGAVLRQSHTTEVLLERHPAFAAFVPAEPVPEPPPPPPTWPDASNTGPRAVLTSSHTGTLYPSAGQVIERMRITGDVIVEAPNVTLRDCLIEASTWHAVRSYHADATGFRMEHCAIDGKGATTNGVLGRGDFIGCDIHGCENAINTGGPSHIEACYLHDFAGNADSHYDGIECNGGSDIQIIGNHIVVNHDQTAAVMLNTYFTGLSNITVDGNKLVGGGYTVYLDGRFDGGTVDNSTISITNNDISGGHWGDFALYGNTPIMHGNI